MVLEMKNGVVAGVAEGVLNSSSCQGPIVSRRDG